MTMIIVVFFGISMEQNILKSVLSNENENGSIPYNQTNEKDSTHLLISTLQLDVDACQDYPSYDKNLVYVYYTDVKSITVINKMAATGSLTNGKAGMTIILNSQFVITYTENSSQGIKTGLTYPP